MGYNFPWLIDFLMNHWGSKNSMTVFWTSHGHWMIKIVHIVLLVVLILRHGCKSWPISEHSSWFTKSCNIGVTWAVSLSFWPLTYCELLVTCWLYNKGIFLHVVVKISVWIFRLFSCVFQRSKTTLRSLERDKRLLSWLESLLSFIFASELALVRF